MIRGKLIERNIIGIIKIEEQKYLFLIFWIENLVYLFTIIWSILFTLDNITQIQITFFICEKIAKLFLCHSFYNRSIAKKIFFSIINLIFDFDLLCLNYSFHEQKTDMFSKFLYQNDPKSMFIERDTTMARVIYVKCLHLLFKLYAFIYCLYIEKYSPYIWIAYYCFAALLLGHILRIKNVIFYSIKIQTILQKLISTLDNIIKITTRIISCFVVVQNIISTIVYYSSFTLVNIIIYTYNVNQAFLKNEQMFRETNKLKLLSKKFYKSNNFIVQIIAQTLYEAFISINLDGVFFQIITHRKLKKLYYNPTYIFKRTVILITDIWVMIYCQTFFDDGHLHKAFFCILSISLAYSLIIYVKIIILYKRNKNTYQTFKKSIHSNEKIKMSSTHQYSSIKLEVNRDLDPILDRFITDKYKESRLFSINDDIFQTVPYNHQQNFSLKKDNAYKICVQDQHLLFRLKKNNPKAIDIFLSYDSYLSIDVNENIQEINERRQTIVKMFSYLIFLNPSLVVSSQSQLIKRLNNEEMQEAIQNQILLISPYKLSITAFFKHQIQYLANNPHAVIYDLFEF